MFTKSKWGEGKSNLFCRQNKGFTLIELLAVIVIIAIIAVIATPIITGIIEDAKKESFKRSAEGVVEATKFDIADKMTDSGYTYTLSDGKIVNLNENVKISNSKGMNGSIKYNKDGEVSYAIYNDKWCVIKEGNDVTLSNNIDKCVLVNTYKEEILNGTYPVLDEKMIAITYTETGIPKVADESSEWYSYASRKWANAVVLVNNPSKTYNVGDEIEESDIAAYFVWIPRYEYTLKGNFGVNGESKTNPGYVDIRFTNVSEESNGTASYTEGNPTNYRTQDAFKFGEENLSGIWVGKFETTGTADNPTIKPGITSLRSQNVSTQFETAKKIGINNSLSLETSMMKNSEWNAVAILSQSIYGRCPSDSTCPEVSINNSSSYITGSSGGSSTASSSNTVYAYNTNEGQTASTTMNVTGVYDMNGGAAEYVMGVLLDSDGKPRSGYNISANSGYNGKLEDGTEKTDGLALPESKYYDSFTITGENTKVDLTTGCNGEKCYGTVEFSGWHGDSSGSMGPADPWLGRGGTYAGGASAGLWRFGGFGGGAFEFFSFRAVIRGA